MSNTQTSTFTDSALSDKVKQFLTRFKDKQGNYTYVDAIDAMMPKNAKYIVVDYNDLVTEPEIEIIFLKTLIEFLMLLEGQLKKHYKQDFQNMLKK
jgi:replicative DNA helicase Mcm (EC 3.6.1.-)